MNHYKKFALTSALFLGVSTGALANGMPELPEAPKQEMCAHLFKGGTYVGGQLGWGRTQYKQTGTAVDPSFAGATQYNYSLSNTKNSPEVGIFAGHRWLSCSGNMAAVELGANFGGKESTFTNFLPLASINSFTLRNKRNYSFSAHLVFGKVFAKRWMPYAKAGVVLTRFNVETEQAALGPDPAVLRKRDYYAFGLSPAVGVAYAFNNAIDMRIEAAYEHHKSFSNNEVFSGAAENRTRIKPNHFKLMVGASYTLKK